VHTKAPLTPVVDWLDSLIGRGGLLLVASFLFAIPILFYFMGGVEKTK
jgi:hypothetical protein